MAIASIPPISLLSATLLTLLFLTTAYSAASIFDLIYKGCANQQFSGGGAASSQQALSSLSSTLMSQSSTARFFRTTSSDQSIFALFQCRGDLSSADCSSCVAKAVSLWSILCGDTVAARVQLAGCYALYEIVGFPPVSGTQMLYKTCGSGNGGGEEFEEKRDTALSSLRSGVAAGGGFDATTYQSVYAMAQCQGDLSSADCSECVEQAVQKSQVECGGANSGQVYLDKCYISYSYYPNGAPTDGGGHGGGGGGGAYREDSGHYSGRICSSGIPGDLSPVCQISNEKER
ncbi:cysteine-rich repeat secretory protein 3-like isoform X2 [Phalaenopsis equestris]|uniref:cysteine-rich repeat secretory protein 3-like isoform X2 n=1 Tax=Phalaenopsis equestris TaxID=78828 RepID=UPI0009E3CA8F|nr:cysteine-rich repeat secretory protein 3-like isoform X2 [Phalaenopsis equestris]